MSKIRTIHGLTFLGPSVGGSVLNPAMTYLNLKVYKTNAKEDNNDVGKENFKESSLPTSGQLERLFPIIKSQEGGNVKFLYRTLLKNTRN